MRAHVVVIGLSVEQGLPTPVRDVNSHKRLQYLRIRCGSRLPIDVYKGASTPPPRKIGIPKSTKHTPDAADRIPPPPTESTMHARPRNVRVLFYRGTRERERE